jgi:hypothetical protein
MSDEPINKADPESESESESKPVDFKPYEGDVPASEPEAPPAAAAPEPEPEPEPPVESLASSLEPEPEDDGSPPYGPGDKIFIHSNTGKFIAVVDARFDSYQAAEDAYAKSFQTIIKKGPKYSYDAPHYLCHLANPAKSPVGACETDSKLKARCED